MNKISIILVVVSAIITVILSDPFKIASYHQAMSFDFIYERSLFLKKVKFRSSLQQRHLLSIYIFRNQLAHKTHPNSKLQFLCKFRKRPGGPEDKMVQWFAYDDSTTFYVI